ncbi:hypothetical protein [Paenibacillus harenae]|uniref:Uncharacterized protein n=1 Tax=Paenibacillus harenae TaxID=306543 RepID=A0ABT9U0S6_PAEHA|nr:hypothetical protein [Paenibacillus harenae]MDQ0113237.1 hypothetical protein [Paenibacillus harenae]
MDKKFKQVLKTLYSPDNSVYDLERRISLYKEESLSPSEQALLREYNWNPNQIEFMEHDAINRKLIAMQQNKHLTRSSVAGLFIAGVGGSFPRGLSVLMSYHLMIHMKEHAYQQAERFVTCGICGFYNTGWEHISRVQYVMHSGHTYGSTNAGAYIDLKELIELEHVVPMPEDIAVFQNLLNSLDRAADDETPGQYEKRLSAEKLLSGNAGIRRGILQSLATVGIVPNRVLPLSLDRWVNKEEILEGESTLNNTKGRSDMEMPWAGWQGRLRVDWDKVIQVFGDYI